MGRKDLVELGPLSVSPMGLGTWAWGNKLLWGYDEQMDEELQVRGSAASAPISSPTPPPFQIGGDDPLPYYSDTCQQEHPLLPGAAQQEVYNLCIRAGVNLFDTADSYGTGALNGQSEKLLGKFMAEYPGCVGSPHPPPP